MQGTVLSEDWGHLTDILENADSAMSHTLYQDTRTANLLGGPTCITGNCPMSRPGKPLSGATATPTV